MRTLASKGGSISNHLFRCWEIYRSLSDIAEVCKQEYLTKQESESGTAVSYGRTLAKIAPVHTPSGTTLQSPSS